MRGGAVALVFDVMKAQGKPDDRRRPSGSCPFCDVDGLTDILRQEDDRIWLMNKYRTLRDTVQTVLIETADHEGDISRYEPAHNRAILRFAIRCWDEMIASGRYRSVLMYKNMGPLSGGSLVHPHLQIVGLEHEDGYAALGPQHFEGLDVWSSGRVRVTISTEPIMGFFEVNVLAPDGVAESADPADEPDANRFFDAVQVAVRYILNEHHGGRATSYNLFFYRFCGQTIAKVLPRWVVSPYFVGYRLAQVNAETTLEGDRARLAELLGAVDASGSER